MKNRRNAIRQNVLPVLTALIWGTAFVAQSVAAERIQPFTFNAARSLIAFIALLAAAAAFACADRKRGSAQTANGNAENRQETEKAPKCAEKKERIFSRDLLIGGVCCGLFLTVASNLQQLGLGDTSPGKAGFITALYVVLVPVFGLFLKKKAPAQVWAGAVLAVAGLYLLCIKEDFSVQPSDFYVFLCAVVFAVHILCVDHFVQKVDGLRLSCAQFLVMAVLSGACALLFEDTSLADITSCLPQLLYVGVFSSGVGYTLQILSQKDSDPTVVTILLSLESVFSVIAGAVILGDRLSVREYIGCVLMFAAVILAQVPLPRGKARRQRTESGSADR